MIKEIKHPKMTAFVLLLSAFMSGADTMTLQPILDLLATEVFPEAGYAMVSMIMSASAITLALVSIATGSLTRFGKKRLILLGSVLFAVGGCAGALFSNIYLIIFTRLFEGLGAGLVMTVSLMLIPELFQDQKQVDKIMGYNGVLMALFSGIITFTSGYLAMISWRLPFLYYAVGFIVLILQWIYVPADTAVVADVPAVRSKLNKAGVLHGLSGFTFGVITSFFFVCISGVVAENGIGDASVAGTVATFNTVGSFISGFLFAAVFGKLKRFSFSAFYVILAIATFGVITANSSVVLCAIAVLNGFGWNWFFSAYLAKVPMFSDESSMDANMAMANGAFYVGQFVTPFVLSIITSITGNASTVYAMRVDLVLLIAFAVIHFICAIIGNAQEKKAA